MTRVQNLEKYALDPRSVAERAQKRFACAAAAKPINNNAEKLEVILIMLASITLALYRSLKYDVAHWFVWLLMFRL